jgi:hypothetical protein
MSTARRASEGPMCKNGKRGILLSSCRNLSLLCIHYCIARARGTSAPNQTLRVQGRYALCLESAPTWVEGTISGMGSFDKPPPIMAFAWLTGPSH